jgi:hypothetical protein
MISIFISAFFKKKRIFYRYSGKKESFFQDLSKMHFLEKFL